MIGQVLDDNLENVLGKHRISFKRICPSAPKATAENVLIESFCFASWDLLVFASYSDK